MTLAYSGHYAYLKPFHLFSVVNNLIPNTFPFRKNVTVIYSP